MDYTLQRNFSIQKLRMMISIRCVAHIFSLTQNDLISINIRRTNWRRWKWNIDFFFNSSE